MREVLGERKAWTDAGEGIAVATVVETWGSSPRPLGSRMAVTRSGKMAGSVSNGCIEGAVFEEAQQVLKAGKPKLAAFGVTDDVAFSVGLACGGHIEVYIQPFGTEHERLLGLLVENHPATLKTNLVTGESELAEGAPSGSELAHRRGDWFVEPFRRPAHLVLVGAIGSRKTNENRFAALRSEGFTDDQISRVHGPIGLDLGGRGAEETALGILAEITAVRFGGSGSSMREVRARSQTAAT